MKRGDESSSNFERLPLRGKKGIVNSAVLPHPKINRKDFCLKDKTFMNTLNYKPTELVRVNV